MSSNILYRSILRSLTGRYTVYAANALSTVVLARLFSPTQFGIVASIMVFYVFFQMMAEAGLGPAIVNVNILEEKDRDGIFTLTVIFGAILSLLLFLAGPSLASFYRVKEVIVVIPYVAVSVFFFSCSILPIAFLLREQSFYRLGIAGVLSELLSLVFTVGLLQIIPSLHALSAKGLIAALINFCMVYYFSKNTSFNRPRLGSKLNAIKPLLGFTVYQFGYNFLNYFIRNLDNILVGKYLGPPSLGIYEKAYKLMKYPLMLLTFAMTPAIQPVLRKHVDDVCFVEKIHRDFTLRLCGLGVLAGLVCFFFASQIVHILLGSQWDEVVPIFKIFSISIPVQVVLATSGSFFQAFNKPKLLFLAALISGIFFFTFLIYGVQQNSMIAIAWSLTAAFHVNFIVVYFILYRFVFKMNTIRFFLPMTLIFTCLLAFFIRAF